MQFSCPPLCHIACFTKLAEILFALDWRSNPFRHPTFNSPRVIWYLTWIRQKPRAVSLSTLVPQSLLHKPCWNFVRFGLAFEFCSPSNIQQSTCALVVDLDKAQTRVRFSCPPLCHRVCFKKLAGQTLVWISIRILFAIQHSTVHVCFSSWPGWGKNPRAV